MATITIAQHQTRYLRDRYGHVKEVGKYPDMNECVIASTYEEAARRLRQMCREVREMNKTLSDHAKIVPSIGTFWTEVDWEIQSAEGVLFSDEYLRWGRPELKDSCQVTTWLRQHGWLD